PFVSYMMIHCNKNYVSIWLNNKNIFANQYNMKKYLGLLFWMVFFVMKASVAQEVDSLIDFSDIEFVESDPVSDTEGTTEVDTAAQIAATDTISGDSPRKDVAGGSEKGSLWGIFIGGILGGFAALLMPCIFPMLPLTVSF